MVTPAELFKALSDETRLRCIMLLHKKKEICVCEFIDILKYSQPKVSRHLSSLKKTALVLDKRKEQWVYYRLNEKAAPWVKSLLLATSKGLEKQKPFAQDLKKLPKTCSQNSCC